MDRNEAIQTLSKVGKISVSYAEDLYDSFFPKPVVPGFIAEWIEEAKNKQGYNVVGAVNNAPSGDIGNWLILENVDIFTKAWVYDYIVENEPIYKVRFKGMAYEGSYLSSNLFKNDWYVRDEKDEGGIIAHTRKELEEAGFGWIFSCEGIEVEEVE